MAIKYLKGGGAGDGNSWAGAYTDFVTALAALSPGDTLYIAHGYDQSYTATQVFLCPGTLAAPVNILCVDDASEPPTALEDGSVGFAHIYTTGSFSISIRGVAYIYGVNFTSNAGVTTTVASVLLSSLTDSPVLTLEKCTLGNLSNNTGASITFGNSVGGTGNKPATVTLIDCAVKFRSSGGVLQVGNAKLFSRGLIIDTSVNTMGSFITSSNTTIQSYAEIEGSDLTGITDQVVEDTSGLHTFKFINCKIPEISDINSATQTAGADLYFYNCDSGGTNYRFRSLKASGVVRDETTIVRTNGATDGTTPISWRLESSALAGFSFPLEAPRISGWNDGTSAITLTAQIITDNVTLTDEECWIEVSYLGSAMSPQATIVSDRKADILATAANQPTSAATWTTTGLTTPVKQALSVTFTPAQKGPWQAKIMLAKPNTTIYVCPKIEVS